MIYDFLSDLDSTESSPSPTTYPFSSSGVSTTLSDTSYEEVDPSDYRFDSIQLPELVPDTEESPSLGFFCDDVDEDIMIYFPRKFLRDFVRSHGELVDELLANPEENHFHRQAEKILDNGRIHHSSESLIWSTFGSRLKTDMDMCIYATYGTMILERSSDNTLFMRLGLWHYISSVVALQFLAGLFYGIQHRSLADAEHLKDTADEWD